MKIAEHKIRTIERVVHNLPAVVPQLVTMGCRAFHLFIPHTNMKHAVTSWVQICDTYSFYARKQAMVPLGGQMLKCQQ